MSKLSVYRLRVQQGVALVLVLWVLSLLTIMAGGFTLTMRRETAVISGLKNNAQALATAESGLAIAEFMLLNPDTNKRWRADGSIYQIDAGNAILRIQLLSETGKIDLNSAEPAVLQSLMNHAPRGSTVQLPSMSINRAATLLDWRDNDDLVSINGAEKQQYQDVGLSYAPRNRSFQAFEELQMVLGMDEATLNWLEPLVTIYLDPPQLDLQLASKEVLQIVTGADDGIIDAYLMARIASAKNNLSAPLLPFNASESTATESISVLNIISEVQLSNQSTAVINAVVKKSDGMQAAPYQVLRWQHSTAKNASLFMSNKNQLVVKHYVGFELNQ